MAHQSTLLEYTQFESLVTSFKDSARVAGGILKEMLDTVEGGRLPSSQNIHKMHTALEDLQVRYDGMYQSALNLLGNEAPERGVSINDLESALEPIKGHVVAHLREAERILEDFLAVRAKVSGYMEELEDWRAKATTLLSQVREGYLSLDSLEQAVEPYDLFLKALDMLDEDSEEKEVLFGRIDDLFSAKISRGLYSGKYCLERKTEAYADAVDVPSSSLSSEISDEHSPESFDVEPEMESGEDRPSYVSSILPHERAEQFLGEKAVPYEGDAAESTLTCEVNDAQGITLAEEPEEGGLLGDYSEEKEDFSEDGELFNASLYNSPMDIKAFVKTNIGKADYLLLFQLFTNFRIATLEQLTSLRNLCAGHKQKGSISSVVSLLVMKKLVKKITCKGLPAVYVMPRCKKAVVDAANEKGIKLDERFSSYRSCPDMLRESYVRRVVAYNDILIRYLNVLYKRNLEDFQSALESILLYDSGAKISVMWNSHSYICSLALPDARLSEDRLYRLFVTREGEDLPILKDVPNGVVCLACHEGSIWRWELEDGWKLNNIDMLSQQIAKLEQELDEKKKEHTESEQSEDGSLDNKELSPVADFEEREVDFKARSEESNLTALNEYTPLSSPIVFESAKGSESEDAHSTEGKKFQVVTKNEKDDTPIQQELFGDETVAQIASRLAERHGVPSDEEFNELICRLLDVEKDSNRKIEEYGHLAQAIMLGKSASLLNCPKTQGLCDRIERAVGIASGIGSYAGYSLNQLFSSGGHSQSLTLAAYMHALLAPDEHDFTLHDQANMYLREYETYFPSYPALKPLFAALCGLHEVEPKGFTSTVLAQLESEEEKAESMRVLQKRAVELMAEPTISVHLSGIPDMMSSCFGHKSDYHQCMEIIVQNRQQERDLVKDILLEIYTELDDSYELDDDRLDRAIDSAWTKATKNLKTKRLTLKMVARKQIREEFLSRLELMKDWLESAIPLDSLRAERLRKLKSSLLRELDELPDELVGGDAQVRCPAVVSYMVASLRDRLEKPGKKPLLFVDALRTGRISLDDRYQPLISKEMNDIQYYEPWRRVLLHIADVDATLEGAETAISSSPSSHMFDNLHQLELLIRWNGGDARANMPMDKAIKRAKEKTKDIKGRLELAYAAGRLTEQDKEDMLQMLLYEEEFIGSREFGCWKQFLEALERQMLDKERFHRLELQKQIDQRRGTLDNENFLDTAERMLGEGQFAVAEEYVNVFDRNEGGYPEDLRTVFEEEDQFTDFIQQEHYEKLYNYALNTLKGRSMAKSGPDFLRKNFPTEWTSSYRDESIKFIQNWPSAKGKTVPDTILAFIQSLGISASAVKRLARSTEDVFELNVRRSSGIEVGYPHPIADFGTRMKSPLTVMVLYGFKLPEDIFNKVSTMNLPSNGVAVVLLDYSLSISQRIQLAELCHQQSDASPFIVIDRVLALHLALSPASERMSILLACSLPFASALQPFVRDGGPTSPEMFCARTRELKDILNPNGTCLVYGGRQLGKTALLQRAESRAHDPSHRSYAFYCAIRNKSDESSLVKSLVEKMTSESSLSIKPCETLEELCSQLETLFRKEKAQALLLLIDEADAFLNAASADAYNVVQPLVELKRRCPDFKFVFAGLNNVYRARVATQENGVFGQLGQPLCIKPLSPADALRLILRPLWYLGFRPGKDAHLETILSATNYYPGILQFVGYKLADSLNNNYVRYSRASECPPLVSLTSEHLGSIMREDDLNLSIKEKFRLSLSLDERYHMLARCIAMLYHYQSPMAGNSKGYTIAEISDMVTYYGINSLKKLAPDEYEALLDEMYEMGILHRTEPGIYRLRKRSFLDIIGADMSRLDEEIVRENARSDTDGRAER